MATRVATAAIARCGEGCDAALEGSIFVERIAATQCVIIIRSCGVLVRRPKALALSLKRMVMEMGMVTEMGMGMVLHVVCCECVGIRSCGLPHSTPSTPAHAQRRHRRSSLAAVVAEVADGVKWMPPVSKPSADRVMESLSTSLSLSLRCRARFA